MKLKALIENHDAHSSRGSLKDNLGDGYLLKMNPIYAKIRSHALRAGFQFKPGRFFDYDALPLTQLPAILSKKIVPYHNTVRPLREIERCAPGVFSLSQIPPLRANQLFHESAHALAHVQVFKLQKSWKISREGEKLLVFKTLLEESFANACESLSNIYSSSEIHDEFLYKNSYIMEETEERVLLKNAVSEFGRRSVFELLILAFLHANFLRTKEIRAAFPRALRLVFGVSPQNTRLLKSVFKTGFSLDDEFTVFTNAFCLRLMGVKTDLHELFQFDFLNQFETDETYSEVLKRFSGILD